MGGTLVLYKHIYCATEQNCNSDSPALQAPLLPTRPFKQLTYLTTRTATIRQLSRRMCGKIPGTKYSNVAARAPYYTSRKGFQKQCNTTKARCLASRTSPSRQLPPPPPRLPLLNMPQGFQSNPIQPSHLVGQQEHLRLATPFPYYARHDGFQKQSNPTKHHLDISDKTLPSQN